MKCDHASFYSDSVYRCLKCEGHEKDAVEAALLAADALAKALDMRLVIDCDGVSRPCDVCDLKDALAAYEKVRR